MRRRLLFVLVLLNVALAVSLLSAPAWTQIIPRGLFDCCKVDNPGEAFCCRGCCWFVRNCDEDEDCTGSEEGG